MLSVLLIGKRHGNTFAMCIKAVVGGTAGPAMAGPLFLPIKVLDGPLFWSNMLFWLVHVFSFLETFVCYD